MSIMNILFSMNKHKNEGHKKIILDSERRYLAIDILV